MRADRGNGTLYYFTLRYVALIISGIPLPIIVVIVIIVIVVIISSN